MSDRVSLCCQNCYQSFTGWIYSSSLCVRLLYSAGGGGEVEGHALVSPGPARPERHQPELLAHAHRSRWSKSMWVHLLILIKWKALMNNVKPQVTNSFWCLNVCLIGPMCVCVCVCLLTQGRYLPVMPSSTCFRHVGCGQRLSVHVPVLQKPWLSPSGGVWLLLHLARTKATGHGYIMLYYGSAGRCGEFDLA